MDKLYKPLFVKELKRLMAEHFASFSQIRVPTAHPQREVFSGAALYSWSEPGSRAVWLWWVPGPGVERYFEVLVGWSPGIDILPHSQTHDPRLYSLRGPATEIPAGAISLQQIQGESAIGRFTIPTPWDQLYSLKPTTQKRAQAAVMQKAYSEAMALTECERQGAVTATLMSVFASLRHVVPNFIKVSEQSPSDA